MGAGQGKQSAEGSGVYGVRGMCTAEAIEICVCGVGGGMILAIFTKICYYTFVEMLKARRYKWILQIIFSNSLGTGLKHEGYMLFVQ